MGRLFDKWMGTGYPDGGVEPLPVLEVRGALLALGGPDARFRVRNALPGERADLVAECRVPEVCLTLKTRMLFVPSKREVRALDEQWEERSQEHSRGQYGRGPATMVYRKWEFRRGPTADATVSRPSASTPGTSRTPSATPSSPRDGPGAERCASCDRPRAAASATYVGRPGC
ncbi:hypothetical protein GCM10020254_72570 [Streptomyces goshikiensis]